MANFRELDKCLSTYIHEMKTWSPDRLVQVNLETLKRLDLLNYFHIPEQESELTRYFQVAETSEKITLVNEDFVIWIVPEAINGTPATYTFIALNEQDTPQLEVTFLAQGVYNSSKLIMRVLEKLLSEIKENEDLLTRYKNL